MPGGVAKAHGARSSTEIESSALVMRSRKGTLELELGESDASDRLWFCSSADTIHLSP